MIVVQDMNAFMALVAWLMINRIGLAKKFSQLHAKVNHVVRILTVILAFSVLNHPMAVIKSAHLHLHLHSKDSRAARTLSVPGDFDVFSTVTMVAEISATRFLMNMIQILLIAPMMIPITRMHTIVTPILMEIHINVIAPIMKINVLTTTVGRNSSAMEVNGVVIKTGINMANVPMSTM